MIDFVHTPINEHPASRIWAWLSVDHKGNEGIMGAIIAPLGATPLVYMHERLHPAMRALAKAA